MQWFYLFSAAVHTLAQLSPSIIEVFGGGARNTASKIGSALAVADTVTSALARGMVPVIDPDSVHHELADHTQALATGAERKSAG